MCILSLAATFASTESITFDEKIVMSALEQYQIDGEGG